MGGAPCAPHSQCHSGVLPTWAAKQAIPGATVFLTVEFVYMLGVQLSQKHRHKDQMMASRCLCIVEYIITCILIVILKPLPEYTPTLLQGPKRPHHIHVWQGAEGRAPARARGAGGWFSTFPGSFLLVLFLDWAADHRLGRVHVAISAEGEL